MHFSTQTDLFPGGKAAAPWPARSPSVSYELYPCPLRILSTISLPPAPASLPVSQWLCLANSSSKSLSSLCSFLPHPLLQIPFPLAWIITITITDLPSACPSCVFILSTHQQARNLYTSSQSLSQTHLPVLVHRELSLQPKEPTHDLPRPRSPSLCHPSFRSHCSSCLVHLLLSPCPLPFISLSKHSFHLPNKISWFLRQEFLLLILKALTAIW